jgi:hypothetical protein
MKLTSLKRVKEWLGLKGAEFDDVINNMIDGYSMACSNFTNRDLVAKDYSEVRNGNGRCKMMLQNSKLTAQQLQHQIMPLQKHH